MCGLPDKMKPMAGKGGLTSYWRRCTEESRGTYFSGCEFARAKLTLTDEVTDDIRI
jgi:hypothetical protein